MAQATADLELAKLGDAQIVVLQKTSRQRKQDVTEAERALQLARNEFGLHANHRAVRLRHRQEMAAPRRLFAHRRSDFQHLQSDFMYVTVHLEETRLEGVNPGNAATLRTEAYSEPFHGRVVWIGTATGANFSLIPRDLSSGEFTYVVQRVPTRIAIERDARWPRLNPACR